MSRPFIVRTKVMPNGGICHVVLPRPQITLTFEEVEKTPLSRWMETWGKDYFPTESITEEFAERARDPRTSIPPINMGEYILSFQPPEFVKKVEEDNLKTLQFMWDAMPLELKQEIVAKYHPHNCVKKDVSC